MVRLRSAQCSQFALNWLNINCHAMSAVVLDCDYKSNKAVEK